MIVSMSWEECNQTDTGPQGEAKWAKEDGGAVSY